MTTLQDNNGGLKQNNFASSKNVDEKERIEKIFLDELGTLRREEMMIIEKFNLRIPEDIFISNWESDFSFEKNLELFFKELSLIEERIYKLSGSFNQIEINQALSQLRILREKANTALDKSRECLKRSCITM